MTAISESVRLETVTADVGDIAVIVIDNPPVNALSWHVRQGLAEGMTQAVDGGASAVVLICEGRTFIAGADISEFGGEARGPSLPDTQAAMENGPVPVIAAIHGTALGGGLEVALCAHYRVALASAKFGLPEVNLGLLPGAGGTQRLPRLVGVPKALEMMTSGRHIDRRKRSRAVSSTIVRRRSGQNCGGRDRVREPCCRRELAAQEGPRPRRQGARAPGRHPALRRLPGIDRPQDPRLPRPRVQHPMHRSRRQSAVRRGLKVERKLFMELMTGPQSAAQRYAFFAERAANKIPTSRRTPRRSTCRRAGVLGAGTMGGGIAMNFANAGIPVTIVERDQESLDRGLGVVRKNYERSRVTWVDPTGGGRAADGADHRLDRQGRLRRLRHRRSRRCSRTWS
jgi:3-hydroxyacyl-CoA dehydrogenase